MVVTALAWIFLHLFIFQHAHSKVIIINTSGGSNSSTECCVDGKCPCSSLSTALLNITNNTVINVTSEIVALQTSIQMGIPQKQLNAITITSNGATILCNNSGSITCRSCADVIIEGITLDQCGSSFNSIELRPGLAFYTAANISIFNCTFQNSSTVAVSLFNVYDDIIIDKCNFISNRIQGYYVSPISVGGLSISCFHNRTIYVIINANNFYNNGYYNGNSSLIQGFGLIMKNADGQANGQAKAWNITMSQTNFSHNSLACLITADSFNGTIVMLTELFFYNNTSLQFYHALSINVGSKEGKVVVSILLSVFHYHEELDAVHSDCTSGGIGIKLNTNGDAISFMNNSNITGNRGVGNSIIAMACIGSGHSCLLHFNNVYITNNKLLSPSNQNTGISGILSILSNVYATKVIMNEVKAISNKCYYYKGSTVYIESTGYTDIALDGCNFFNNTSVRGAAIYISLQAVEYPDDEYLVTSFKRSVFDHNIADESIIFIDSPTGGVAKIITISASDFTNNVGVCMFLSQCELTLVGDVSFLNNSANSGGALYIDETSTVYISDGANVSFVDNYAISHGGAIFVELNFGCDQNHITFSLQSNNTAVSFINSDQLYNANSLYFSVSKYCNINLKSREESSLMYVPYQFNYFQVVNGILVRIPYDYNYTQLTVPNFPVMTSPHQLKLYKLHGDHIMYVDHIRDQVLGNPIKFNGILLDYFDKPAGITEFHVQCLDDFTLVSNQLVFDNVSPLNVILVGKEIRNSTNVTLLLHSQINYHFQQIKVTLIIELVPCYYHPGYTFNETLRRCVCYHHDVVECYDDYNEIKRGYWFGSVNGKATTSLCYSQYCEFVNRKMTRQGYFQLPERITDQCDHHRSGPACGKCSSPGHTLSYDSTDCISVDHCSTGITVLVVVLTCLYWIISVGGVFCIMYFNFQLSSGYLYGIIYYYSMVNILLSSNPYISDGAFQFVNILSGFAQLNPRFLGKLCLVEGMSGIDQLFIHYSHAGAISVMLFGFVLVAKYSRRVSELISRCIIRVFCFLLLLAYTSLVSTSLQLLRPLTFTNINEVYTYSSPNINYFQGRHALYGTVALICEVIIGIGLPLLMLLEPFLKRKINLIRFKPILDQFQGCYKDKYRWFAAYYLICRQVIMVIVLLGNNNYDSMLFYLVLTCLVIAAVHACLRPYKSKFLNIFDGLILQMMIAVVIVSSFEFLQSATTTLVLVLVIIPLIVMLIAASVRKVVHCNRRQYFSINEGSDDDDYDDETIR